MSVKITQFKAENVKRIKALTLTPAPTGLTVGSSRKSIKVSLLRDLLLAGYDPAEICFAVVDGTALV